MNGLSEGLGSSGSSPNGEGLDAVLGRFQNWAKARRQEPASKGETSAAKSRGSFPRKSNLTEEAREIPYEQALRASLYRRPAKIAPHDPPPAPIPSHDSRLEAGKASRRGDRRTPDFDPKPEAPLPAAAATQTGAAGATAARSPGAKGTQTKAPRARERRAVVPAPPKLSVPTFLATPAVLKTKPKQATELPRGEPGAPPAFRDVFKETAALSAVVHSIHSPATLERGKSASLTLRVSDQEQLRIQACAAHANLSVSAYLRQCALGVDSLRDQVGLALADLHQQQVKAAAPPGLSALPGIFGRFATQCWRRLGRKSGEPTILSLR